MNKEQMAIKLHDMMSGRAVNKLEKGKRDFKAYPLLGQLAVSCVVGIGSKSDAFYEGLNKDIASKWPAQIYANRYDDSNGGTDWITRIRNLADGGTAAEKSFLADKVVTRVISYPSDTQNE